MQQITSSKSRIYAKNVEFRWHFLELEDIRVDLFDEGDVGLGDVDDEVLVAVREQVLDDVEDGGILGTGDADEQDDAGGVGVEPELSRLDVDVTGQDVVQDDVLHEVAAVVFLVVELLDAAEGNGQDAGILLGEFIFPVDKDGVLMTHSGVEGQVGRTVEDDGIVRIENIGNQGLVLLPDALEFAAGDNGAGLIDDTDGAVDGVSHLVNDTLEKSIGHRKNLEYVFLYLLYNF